MNGAPVDLDKTYTLAIPDFVLLGGDGYGRDVFARLVHGARLTLLLALIATLGATLVGGVIGAVVV